MVRDLSEKKSTLLSLSVGAVVLASQVTYAEEQDNVLKADVVVVGETTNDSITSVDLEFQQASDMSDVFRHIPSVTVGGSLGIAQKIYLRGLEDTLLNITVDGAPQTGTLFHHVGRVSIEPELLKEVDIQTGAGEATSGFGAIGGAIRFKTKRAEDLLAPGQDFGGIVKGSIFTNDGKKGSLSLFGRLGENWGVLGSFVTSDLDNMEDGDGNEMFGTAVDQDLGFVKISGDLSENQYLSFSFERRDESGDFGQRPNWPVLEEDPLFPLEGERQTIVANYSLTPSDVLNLEATAYFTESELTQDRYDRWGEYRSSVETLGFDLRNTTFMNDNYSLTYGVELRRDTVTSGYLGPDSVLVDWAWDPNIRTVKEEGKVLGVYLQNHWQLMEALLLSYGVRYDRYELEQVTYNDETDSDGVSPNVGLRYALTNEIALTAGHARALRGKEVGDGFTVERDPSEPSLDANLDPEKAQNTELGIEYTDADLALKASVYKSKLDDVIFDQLGRGVYYENIGELESEGVELLAAYKWNKFYFALSFSHNDSELNGNPVSGYEHNGLATSRGDTWSFEVNYQWSPALEMGWYVTYVDGLSDIEVLQRGVELGWIDQTQTVDKPSYQVHDVYLSWKPSAVDNLTLNFAIQNLFDKRYRDHSSVADYTHIPDWDGVVGLNEAGRDIRFSVAYQF
ncbi:MAG: TonB-dependent receptor [Pseudomonadales bacterium]|nr:TonB-dependent receptor [Pseudomonadales bacterium]